MTSSDELRTWAREVNAEVIHELERPCAKIVSRLYPGDLKDICSDPRYVGPVGLPHENVQGRPWLDPCRPLEQRGRVSHCWPFTLMQAREYEVLGALPPLE